MTFLQSGNLQVLIAAVIVGLGPGIFNGFTALGGGGHANEATNTTANVLLYGTYMLSAFFQGSVFNIIRHPGLLMAFSIIFYGLYTIALKYVDETKPYTMDIFLVASAVLGIMAGTLWSAQGAITISYPIESKKGRYFGFSWVIFNFVPVLFGLIVFAISFNDDSGSVSDVVYWLFIAIEFVAAVLAFFLLINPKNVIREDGSTPIVPKQVGFVEQIRATVSAFLSLEMILLAPLFFH